MYVYIYIYIYGSVKEKSADQKNDEKKRPSVLKKKNPSCVHSVTLLPVDVPLWPVKKHPNSPFQNS